MKPSFSLQPPLRRLALLGAWSLLSLPAMAQYQQYVVQSGDSLQTIAQRMLTHGGNWQQLRDYNGIPSGTQNFLRPGQILKIRNDWVQAPPPPPPPPPPPAPAPVSADLTSAGQGVSISQGGQALPVGAGTKLTEGARIKTGAQGATFKLQDGSVAQVAAGSEVQLEQLRKDPVSGQLRSVFRLLTGSIQMAVTKIQNPGADRLRITTPTATMGIRGTTFRVSALGSGTTSEVLEGRAELDAQGKLVPLPGGFGSKADAGARPIDAVPLLPAPSQFTRLPYLEMKPTSSGASGRIEWAQVAGAGSYEVSVATDEKFENLVFQQKTTAAQADLTNIPHGYVYVRTRAYDANGIGGYDLIQSIKM